MLLKWQIMQGSTYCQFDLIRTMLESFLWRTENIRNSEGLLPLMITNAGTPKT